VHSAMPRSRSRSRGRRRRRERELEAPEVEHASGRSPSRHRRRRRTRSRSRSRSRTHERERERERSGSAGSRKRRNNNFSGGSPSSRALPKRRGETVIEWGGLVLSAEPVPPPPPVVESATAGVGTFQPLTGAALARAGQLPQGLAGEALSQREQFRPSTLRKKEEKPPVCIKFLGGTCPDKLNCLQRHPETEEDIAHWLSYFKTRQCRWRSRCMFRPKCIYGHPEDGTLPPGLLARQAAMEKLTAAGRLPSDNLGMDSLLEGPGSDE